MTQKIRVDHVYQHSGNGFQYRPLFTHFKNKEGYVVYISEHGKVWCKTNERFNKGMRFKEVNSNAFLFDLNDVPEAFYVNEKVLVNKKTGEKGTICCFANANAEENKKEKYPLMVVLNIDNEFHLYTFAEFESLFLQP